MKNETAKRFVQFLSLLWKIRTFPLKKSDFFIRQAYNSGIIS